MAKEQSVAVIGAGLAGLSAATLLARAGRKVRVFEGAAQAGGRARTRALDGFYFNQGAHALYRRGAGRGVLDELGVRASGAAPPIRGGFGERTGRLHTLPTGPLSLLTTGLLTLSERLEVGRLMAALPRLDPRPHDGISLDDWLLARGLRPGSRALLRALARLTTYADAPGRVSAGTVLLQLRLGTQGVLYLHEGWQTLVDALLARAREAGAEVCSGAPVRALAVRSQGLELTLASGERHAADAAVLAVSPGDVSELVAQARLPRCEPVRAACLDVALRRLPRPGTFALGIDRPTYVSVHSASARLAPSGAALVHVVRYLGSDAQADAAELEEALERLQPGWRDEVVHQRFLPEMTVSHALVEARTGGLAGRPDVDALGLPNVFLAGDWVGPHGLLADASLASARRAALALLGQGATGSPVRAMVGQVA